MTGKVAIFRFKQYCPPAELMASVIDRIGVHEWAGKTGFPARLEWYIGKDSKPSHFPIDPVCFTREDADALLAAIDALDAIVCTVPVDVEARKAAAAATKFKAAKAREDARPKPDPASLVKPSLRHLLGEAGREEGRRLLERLEALDGGSPDLVALADRLPEDFPLFAQADEALDGTIRATLRQAGRLTGPVDAFDKLAWTAVAKAVADGNVEFLTSRFVDGKKNPGLVERALVALAVLRWRHDGMPPCPERLTVLYA